MQTRSTSMSAAASANPSSIFQGQPLPFMRKPPVLTELGDFAVWRHEFEAYARELSVLQGAQTIPLSYMTSEISAYLQKRTPWTSTSDTFVWLDSLAQHLTPPRPMRELVAALSKLRLDGRAPLAITIDSMELRFARQVRDYGHKWELDSDLPALVNAWLTAVHPDLRAYVKAELGPAPTVGEAVDATKRLAAMLRPGTEYSESKATTRAPGSSAVGGTPQKAAKTAEARSTPTGTARFQRREWQDPLTRRGFNNGSGSGPQRPGPPRTPASDPRGPRNNYREPAPVTRSADARVNAVDGVDQEDPFSLSAVVMHPDQSPTGQVVQVMLDTQSSKSFVDDAWVEAHPTCVQDVPTTGAIDFRGFVPESRATASRKVRVQLQVQRQGQPYHFAVEAWVFPAYGGILLSANDIVQHALLPVPRRGDQVNVVGRDTSATSAPSDPQTIPLRPEGPAQVDDFDSPETELGSGALDAAHGQTGPADPLRFHSDGIVYLGNDQDLHRQLAAVAREYDSVFDPVLPPTGARLRPLVLVPKPGASLPRSKPRRFDRKTEDEIDKQVEDWLAAGIIRESDSIVSSPCVPVRKANGELRLAQDYVALNGCLEPGVAWPIPNSVDIFESLQGAKYVITADCRSGYLQQQIHPESRWLTAFCTRRGLYEFNRVSFGLTSAPSAFCREMARVLGPILGPRCHFYLDDVLLMANTPEELVALWRQLLERLHLFDMRLRADKVRAGGTEAEFLGHLISDGRAIPAPQHLDGIDAFPLPETPRKLKSFLGLVAYVAASCPGLHAHTAVLHELAASCKAKQRKLVWTAHTRAAFEGTKQCVRDAQPLHSIDYSKNIFLATDASERGLGFHLYQEGTDGVRQHLAFGGQKLTPAQQRYSTVVLEMFGVISGVRRYRRLLWAQRFTVLCDHKNLAKALGMQDKHVRRWAAELMEYDVQLLYHPGQEQVVPDAISRCFHVAAAADEPLGPEVPDVVVPRNVDPAHLAIMSAHHGPTVGHRSADELVRRMREAGHSWRGQVQDARQFVRSCIVCALVKSSRIPVAATMASLSSNVPFEEQSVDLLGPFPKSKAGYVYVVAVTCAFSRFTVLEPTSTCTAEEVSGALVRAWSWFGVPKTLRTDCGAAFVAATTKRMFLALNISHVTAVPEHHESNGIQERRLQVVLAALRAITLERDLATSWDAALPLVQAQVNSGFCAPIGTTPNRVIFGGAIDPMRNIVAGATRPAVELPATVADYVTRLERAQAAVVTAAQGHLRQVIDQRGARRPEQTSLTLSVGDYAKVKASARDSNKLSCTFRGPYMVTARQGDVYTLQDCSTLVEIQRHINDVRPLDISRVPDPRFWAARAREQWVVEAIEGHRYVGRGRNRRLEYWVRWQDCGPEENQWKPASQLLGLEPVRLYREEHPGI